MAAALPPPLPKFIAFSQFSRWRSLVTWICRKSSAEAAEELVPARLAWLPEIWRPDAAAPSLLARKGEMVAAVAAVAKDRLLRDRAEDEDLEWESGEVGM